MEKKDQQYIAGVDCVNNSNLSDVIISTTSSSFVNGSPNYLCDYSITTTGTDLSTYTSTGSGTLGTNLTYSSIYCDPFIEKETLLKNILNGFIELKSYIGNNFFETFKIKSFNLKSKKTKIVCTKDIDVEYINSLKKETKLLLECIDLPFDDYKKKAIDHTETKFVSPGFYILENDNNFIVINGNNTITINNNNLINTSATIGYINTTVTNANNFIYTA